MTIKNESKSGYIENAYFIKRSRLADSAIIFKTLTLVLSFLLFVLFIITIRLSKKNSKIIPYIIELNKEGDARFAPNVAKEWSLWSPSQTTTMYFLKNYLTDLREVSIDSQVQKKRIEKIYAKTTHAALGEIEKFYKSNPPLERAKKENVHIEIYSCMPLITGGDRTFEIDWNEKTYSNQSQNLIDESNWRAVITIQKYDVRSIEQKNINPLGIYIENISFSKIKDGWARNV